jgi:hypothetical protein
MQGSSGMRMVQDFQKHGSRPQPSNIIFMGKFSGSAISYKKLNF